MYDTIPSDIRRNHPYHMYDEIKAQPEAVRRSLELEAQHGAIPVRLLASARRVFVAGCGTSFYAAQSGAWFLRTFSRGKIDARAVQAYEFVTYLPGLRPDDVLLAVTHAGDTTMTKRALERAHSSGMETIVVTGFPERPAGKRARHVLPTGYAEERSWAHTASYTAALATLAALANGLADTAERLDLTPLPDVMTDALHIEDAVHRVAATALIAEREVGQLRILLTGGGPNAVTADEGVLKLLETSYMAAQAFELEQALHGPLAAVTPQTLVIIVAPPGRSTERAVELMRAVRAIGTVPVVLVGSENAEEFDEAHRLVMPDLPELLSPLPYVVPLQLLSYFLAMGRGVNPDLLHRDDERYRAARAAYR